MIAKKLIPIIVLLCSIFATTQAKVVINEVQYHGTDMVELQNRGTYAVDVSSWWLCSFPLYNQLQNLNLVSGSLMLEPGAYVVLSGHNMDTDDELGLYRTNAFADPNAIEDYLEWTSAPHTRSAVAVLNGTWSGPGQFVPGVPMGSSIEFDGNGNEAGDYTAQAMPTFGTINATTDCDGGTVNSDRGLEFGICVGGPAMPFTASHMTSRPNATYAYIITDTNDLILGLPGSNVIDLSGAPAGICRVWGISYTGTLSASVNTALTSVQSDSCWSFSSNFVTVHREVPDGGTVASSLGNPVVACAGDVIVPVSHTTTANNLSYWYIITDDNDNILTWTTSDTADLSGAPAGTCHIWGWSYRGLPDPIVGQHISSLNNDPCESISSNFIRVIREVPDGGMVASPLGDTIGACAGNVLIPVSHTTTANNLSYWYIITDDNDNILTWTTSDTADLSGAPAGTCHIWGWSYRGLPNPVPGQNISTLNDDPCEEISSNFITVIRETPDGGTVASSLGDTIGACVGNVLIPVSHTTTANNLSYWYIITDDNDNILDWTTSNTADLSGAPAGTCHIWGWSYHGLPDPIVGQNISTLNDDPCEEISSNFITVIRENPDGGMVGSPLGSSIGACAGDVLIPVSHTTTANNLSYWYIITDDNDNILTWTTNDTADLSGAPAGTCHIWGWSYRGLPDPIVGQHISSLNNDPCESISSNFIEVIRENPDGGYVASPLGDSIGACAGNVFVPVSHTTTANNLSYWYIITDVNDSILAWSTTDTLDLSSAPAGICHIWGWSYRGLPNPVPGDHISTLNDDPCEEISNNFLTVNREIPDGGTVSSPLGDTIGACAGNVMIPVSHTTTANNLSYWYIITDDNDNILAWSTSNNLDLSAAPAGICHIWGWSYRGLPDPIVGQNISTLNDDPCEEISSNFITVNREIPDGGMVSSSLGNPIGACAGNVLIPVSHTTTANNLSYWYIITDDNDNILTWTTSDTADLSGAPAGECHIWGWSYRGLPDPIVGQHISSLNNDPCEAISSNFIRVIREEPDGGMVFSPLGDSVGSCAGDVIVPVSHLTTANNLSYWYIITDDNDNILDWSTTDTLDLSGAPAGTCHIWGWSYRGLPDPVVGQNISTLNDDPCEEISSNFITVVREVPDGGMVNSDQGTSVTIIVDGTPDPITLSHTTTANNLSYWYIITDSNDIILDWTTQPVVDLDGAGPGVCRVWGWSYRGLPDPIMGQPISTLNDDACEEISSNFVEVIRELATSLEEPLLDASSFSVYPNPFTDRLSIRLEELAEVEVYNLQGQQVFRRSQGEGEVDLGNLSQGVYQLVLRNQEGRIATQKIVKR